MPVRDDLGTRMKEFYEQVPKFKLYRRTPVAIRIDGKAFHTFTRGFQKPFDKVLIKSMQNTMKYLCENIQGCVLGYTQSDEITLILVDYKNLNSDAWFDYEVQKICSIAASMATMAFNRFFEKEVDNNWKNRTFPINYLGHLNAPVTNNDVKIMEAYFKALNKGAMFDARCFNIPREEVTNLIYWRQLDATRNSIQMVGQANFSHKELQNKSCNDIQDMLMLQKGINWNDFPTHQKRGSCCIKNHDYDEYGIDWGEGWRIDTEIPIFKGEGREYIERLI
jgi:tRNA(His) 5'-end guanylyltransferase